MTLLIKILLIIVMIISLLAHIGIVFHILTYSNGDHKGRTHLKLLVLNIISVLLVAFTFIFESIYNTFVINHYIISIIIVLIYLLFSFYKIVILLFDAGSEM